MTDSIKIPEGVTSQIADEVAEAYHYRCAQGGDCSGRLQIHHIKYRSRGGSDRKENLVLLCGYHHGEVHAGRLLRWACNSWDSEPTEFPQLRRL